MTVTIVCAAEQPGPGITPTVQSVIEQTHTDWELIIVIDGAVRDGAAWIPSDPRIVTVHTPHRENRSAARNVGVSAGRGDVIAYIDQAYHWAPGHLSVLAELLDDGAELAASGARRVTENGDGVRSSRVADLWWHPEIAVMTPTFAPSQVAHRRSLFDQVGRWRPGIQAEDWDFWARCGEAGVRVATSTEQTAVISGPDIRETIRTAVSHHMPLGRFRTLESAHACLARLSEDDRLGITVLAARADALRWFERLRNSPDLVLPRGVTEEFQRTAWVAEVSQLVEEPQRAGSWMDNLQLNEDAGTYVLSWVFRCAAADHAQRMVALSRGILVTQFQLICEAVIASGGNWTVN